MMYEKPVLDECTKASLFQLMVDRQKTDLDVFNVLFRGKPVEYQDVKAEDFYPKKESKENLRASLNQSSNSNSSPKFSGSYGIEAAQTKGKEHKKENTVDGNKFKDLRELTMFMTSMMPQNIELNTKVALLRKYELKLQYNEDGTAKNLVALEEDFKKEIKKFKKGGEAQEA